MLGKLAVRLRMLGFDAAFYGQAEDSFLLRRSKEEQRILLTRDLSLTGIKGANAFFVPGKTLKEQIHDVIKKFNLKIVAEKLFSRCSVCNDLLLKLPKEKVKGKVPPRVFRSFDDFRYSPTCGHYYWPGTHYEKLLRDLQELL